jgi:SAM-dependent methyltransferase
MYDMPDPTRDYLTHLLEQYWFAPPVALWRAVELRILANESFPRPILDLGCGDGLIAQVLFSGNPPIEYGFDPWFGQVQQAPSTKTYRSVQQALGDAMPYRSHQFATVFSNSVLEHIPDLPPVLKEVARVLEPGGRFIATIPSDAFRYLLAGYQDRIAAGDSESAEVYADKVDHRLEHYRYLSPQEWEAILKDNDLRLVQSRYYISAEAAAEWDRANSTYGIHIEGLPFFRWLASPRLRKLGFQKWFKNTIVHRLSMRWRRLYEMDVARNDRGAGLLIVAEKVSG